MKANYRSMAMLARAMNKENKETGKLETAANHQWDVDSVAFVCMVSHNGNINSMAKTYNDYIFAEGV